MLNIILMNLIIVIVSVVATLVLCDVLIDYTKKETHSRYLSTTDKCGIVGCILLVGIVFVVIANVFLGYNEFSSVVTR